MIILFISLFSNIISAGSSNNIIYVDDDGGADYTKIQDAINNATDGDIIFVYNGTYNENIIVTKSVKIIGQNKNNTIINGEKNTSVNISKDYITIEGFTIGNSGDNIFHAGIWINANNTIINQNIIRNNSIGIVIKNFCNNSIMNCDFDNPDAGYYSNYGVWIKGEKGIFNTIENCNIQDNNHGGCSGIYLDTTLNNLIKNCTLKNNGRAIYLHYSNNNDFLNCNVNNIIEIRSLSNNNSFDNCKIMSSISINSGNYNSIKNNIFINADLNLYSCIGSSVINNTFTNKGVNVDYTSSSIFDNNYIKDKPIVFYSKISNIIINQSVGQIILEKCQNITIRNQDISDINRAIQLISSNNCKLFSNELRNNDIGISIQYNSDNCHIFKNYLVDNYEGIKISNGLNSIIENNTIYNSDVAIVCSSNYVSVKNNIINIDDNSIGIKLQYSNNCFINKNEINCYNQNDNNIFSQGIRLRSSDNNMIEKNTISDFDICILIYHSEGNSVYQNNLYCNKLTYFQRAKYDNLDEMFSNTYDDNYYGRLFVIIKPIIGFLLIKESDIPIGWDLGIPFIFTFDLHPARMPYDI